MTRPGPNRPRHGSLGQAILLVAISMTLLFGVIGLAVDAAIGYLWSISAERAAAAAALSGIVFMPNQFSAPPGTNATDRAIAAARQNGFDTADIADNVTVTPARVPITGSSPPANYGNKLQVTVSQTVRTTFMQVLGISTYKVSRTAVASYLPPIVLGQPGGQLGSATSQLGSGGNNYYVLQINGWASDRAYGDAFTSNPAYSNIPPYSPSGVINPPSTDVHKISAATGTEPADPSLPSRGGYNYLITIPPGGGRIQIYNAAFAPDGGPDGASGPHNYCDNFAGWTPCSSGGGNYLQEEFLVNDFSNPNLFAAMRYTLFQVNNQFIRSADVKLTQMTVLPIDATNWNASPPTYCVVTGQPCTGWRKITQTYDPVTGNPTDMSIYHNWADIASYTGDSGVVSLTQYGVPSNYINGNVLAAGTYRLRVDSLDYNGAVSGSGSQNVANKAYAVRVTDPSGNTCASTPGCTLSAWNDICLFTTIVGGSFNLALFQLPPDYAGKTLTIDIFDPGDVYPRAPGTTVDIDVLDPSGAVASSPAGVNIYNLGIQRSNSGSLISPPGNTTATFRALYASSSTEPYNGEWVRIDLPVPSTYAPGTDPSKWWWQLRYRLSATAGASAVDTITVVVGQKGNPAHLTQG